MLKTVFEELEAQLMLTGDRAEQDAILDHWLEIRRGVPVESALAHRYDPDHMGRRQRAALEPGVGRRVKFV